MRNIPLLGPYNRTLPRVLWWSWGEGLSLLSEVPLYHKPSTSTFEQPTRVKCIDYKTSMITDEDPLRGLLFYWDLGFSHTLHVLKERHVMVKSMVKAASAEREGKEFKVLSCFT